MRLKAPFKGELSTAVLGAACDSRAGSPRCATGSAVTVAGVKCSSVSLGPGQDTGSPWLTVPAPLASLSPELSKMPQALAPFH